MIGPPSSDPSTGSRLATTNRRLEHLTWWLTAGTSAVFFVILIAAISLRAIRYPLRASEELGSLFFVWACFGGATVCFRRNQHIRLQFLTDRLSLVAGRRAATIGRWLILVFLLTVCLSSIQVTRLLAGTHMPISGLPQWWLYLPIPVFSSVMILFNVEALLAPFRRSRC